MYYLNTKIPTKYIDKWRMELRNFQYVDTSAPKKRQVDASTSVPGMAATISSQPPRCCRRKKKRKGKKKKRRKKGKLKK